jgi:WD40-like Beta Propeller Repeat
MKATTSTARRRGRTVLAAAIAALITGSAYAGGDHDRSHSAFSDAVPVTEVNSSVADGCPIESEDGLSLFIASMRAGGFGGNDIWAADRDSIDSPWQEPRHLGTSINTSSNDFCPTPVLGRWLFFVSERPGDGTGPTPCGGGDMYLARQSPAGGWGTPTMLKCAPEGPNFPGGERSPPLVPTGSWSAPRNLGDAVNTPGVEQRSTLSHDGERPYFGRDGDIYVSQRKGHHH